MRVRAADGDDTAGCLVHYFADVNGVDVMTTYVDYGFSPRAGVDASLEWSHDMVTIPAIEAPRGSAEAVDAITTASRPIGDADQPYQDYVKTRDALQGAVSYRSVSGRVLRLDRERLLRADGHRWAGSATCARTT